MTIKKKYIYIRVSSDTSVMTSKTKLIRNRTYKDKNRIRLWRRTLRREKRPGQSEDKYEVIGCTYSE